MKWQVGQEAEQYALRVGAKMDYIGFITRWTHKGYSACVPPKHLLNYSTLKYTNGGTSLGCLSGALVRTLSFWIIPTTNLCSLRFETCIQEII